jgi:beta-glucosidase
VTLTNTGSRPTIETVQAYVSDVVTSVSWTDKELKGFTQVAVAPGESVIAQISIPVSYCTIVDARGRRIVEPGQFELLVGPSSRDRDLLRAGFVVQG